jgi:DNA primase
MKLNDIEVNVDYRTELEAFDWQRASWRPEKLIACSPFRDERAPSFYVYLEDTDTASAGNWQDSGSFDPVYSKGGFVKLLAYLRRESEADTVEYLLAKYATGYVPEERFTLKAHPRFGLDAVDHMKPDKLRRLAFRHPYLTNRGIPEEVQRFFTVGYDKEKRAVSIPWRDSRGRLITIKYRSVNSKVFWYDAEGADITAHLFGMYPLYKERPKRAVIVEAEIDAMYLRAAGIAAIATGNKYFSKKRAELIRKSSIEELVIGADNDEAGREMAERIEAALASDVKLFAWTLPDTAKDINDVTNLDEVRRIVDSAIAITRRPSTLL